ncbi:MAG: hypothetical protein U0002_21600 [Thermoanaerobaculia bacterium]
MRFDSLERRLRSLADPVRPPRPGFREELLESLAAHHAARHRPRPVPGRRLRPAVWLAAAVALLVAVGVGALPVSTRLPLGWLMLWDLPAGAPELGISSLLAAASADGAADVSVSVGAGSQGEQRVTLLVLDGEPVAEAATKRLRQRYPQLGAPRSLRLVGELRVSLAEHLRQKVLGVPAAGERDRLAVRRALVRALAAGGYPGAVVEVGDGGGGRIFRIELDAAGERSSPP